MDIGDTSRLCYLTANRLEGPLLNLDHLDVLSADDEPLGQLDGIIFDRSEKRMRYFVVESGGRAHYRYLLPLCPTQIDPEHHALRVDIPDGSLSDYAPFDPHDFAALSDEDLRKVVFYPLPENADRTRIATLRELGLGTVTDADLAPDDSGEHTTTVRVSAFRHS